jgi:hypothetical protein
MNYRRGHTRLEMIVSAFLLTAIIAILPAAFARLSKVWDSTRDFQLASQELSNQLERLTLLSKEDCIEQLKTLPVSTTISKVMPGCSLRGELKEDDGEVRVVLSLHATGSMRREPIVLVGWLGSGAAR